MDLASEVFELGTATNRAKAAPPLPLNDLLSPQELIELAATSTSEQVRRRAAAALYAQGQAHAYRALQAVVS